MRLFRIDLPLNRDPSVRFLPWIIGCMAYVAALTLAATMAADKLASRWNLELAGTFAVQIPPGEAGEEEREAAVARAVDILARVDGIAGVTVIGDDDKLRLLEPWLGAERLPADLPLPDLITVELASGASVDRDSLQADLTQAVPGATVEDYSAWQSDLVAVIRSVKLLSGVIIALIAAATVATVVFVTRTALAIHRRDIEIVHLVGARDSYIARQFLIHALRLGLLGGGGGGGLAVLTLFGLDRLFPRLMTGLWPSLSLDPGHWAVLAAVPVAIAVVGMVTAHMTVIAALGRSS